MLLRCDCSFRGSTWFGHDTDIHNSDLFVWFCPERPTDTPPYLSPSEEFSKIQQLISFLRLDWGIWWWNDFSSWYTWCFYLFIGRVAKMCRPKRQFLCFFRDTAGIDTRCQFLCWYCSLDAELHYYVSSFNSFDKPSTVWPSLEAYGVPSSNSWDLWGPAPQI